VVVIIDFHLTEFNRMKVIEENLRAVDFEKGNGLVPVVVQDVQTKQVLMVAYANREALEKTLKSGYAHYYSRSRKKLLKKGESSGNLQKVKKVLIDCDGDTLLYLVEQKGVACHTGEYSCFFRTLGEEE
jgi:phosphoribosyl-AMP cyclohydrolase